MRLYELVLENTDAPTDRITGMNAYRTYYDKIGTKYIELSQTHPDIFGSVVSKAQYEQMVRKILAERPWLTIEDALGDALGHSIDIVRQQYAKKPTQDTATAPKAPKAAPQPTTPKRRRKPADSDNKKYKPKATRTSNKKADAIAKKLKQALNKYIVDPYKRSEQSTLDLLK